MTRVLSAVLVVAAAGCFTSARSNARVEPGGNVELVFGGFYLPKGIDQDGMNTDASGGGQLELDLQYGWGFDSGGAMAVRARLPINVLLASLDIYVQLPQLADGLWVGVGAELGAMPGAYAVISKYFGTTYLSLTQRVLLRDPYPSAEYETTINPQLSLGQRKESADISVFAGYYEMLGDGIDMEYCFHDCSDSGDDYRRRFVLVGGALRF